MNVLYHPGKANVVANALNRLSMGSVEHVEEEEIISQRCSPACSLKSLPYGHVRWWCDSLEWVRIFIGSRG
ncbi:hypothetical protein MTR67_030935 [Solanum verrucosum]|uniref:Uncharacterized protein n=1 Tax=Solanum verrucosum TaxID=315347 RepID=A0AAF0ZF77_SOLVR|nr:hypothetical protein MTR67_030935 [Solanum verrucosum]